jgi:hypothetical protein
MYSHVAYIYCCEADEVLEVMKRGKIVWWYMVGKMYC